MYYRMKKKRHAAQSSDRSYELQASSFRFFFPFFSRVKELQAAKQVVEKLLPFNFFSEGEMFREMMATHAGNTTYPELPPRRVKHLLVEMYCATKKVNVEKLKLTFQPTLVKSVNPSTVKFNCKL